MFVIVACGSRTELDGTAQDAASFDASADVACTPRDFTLHVSATSPWTDTGIDVAAGAELVIHATGTVSYGEQSNQVCDADGVNYDGQKYFSTAVVPSAIVLALIGKIGGSVAFDTGTPLPEGTPGDGAGFVGISYDQIVPDTGRLFLGFNDQRQAFYDNAGAFTVTIHVGC